MPPPSRGRKRSKADFPAHIDREKLPPGVVYVSRGNGFFQLEQKHPLTGRRCYKRICDSKATLAQIWGIVEAHKQPPQLTFKRLSSEFQASPDWRNLDPSTRADYTHCHNRICAMPTKAAQRFGDTLVAKWTTGTILKYRDKRAESSQSRANKELAYLKRVLAWAKLYEKIKENVAHGVPRLTTKPRKHYAEDKDYHFFLTVARESGYWYMPYLIEISYECALRTCEAVELTDARELPEGLKIVGRKGSNTNIIAWGKNLRRAWDEAKAKRNQIYAARKLPMPIRPEDRYLFISERTGDPVKERAVKTAKARLDEQAKEKAEKLGIKWTPFWLHDIKKKAVSDDANPNKRDKTRHKSLAMVDLYDLKIKTAKPTSDD